MGIYITTLSRAWAWLWLKSLLGRGLGLALLWLVLAEGQGQAWGVGLVTVLIALALSLVLWPVRARSFSPIGALAFVAFFLLQSLRGGLQVARLALQPRLALDPGFIEVPIHLPEGPATIVFLNTLSLLPGTLSVKPGHQQLMLHVLDRRQPVEVEVRAVEARIAYMFRVEHP